MPTLRAWNERACMLVNGGLENNSNTVAFQLKHHTPGVDDNEYPPEDTVFLTCEKLQPPTVTFQI